MPLESRGLTLGNLSRTYMKILRKFATISRRARELEPAYIDDVCSRYAHANATNLAIGAVRWGPPRPPNELSAAHQSLNRYGDVRGLLALRELLLEQKTIKSKVNMPRPDIIITNGANQAMVNVTLATLDVGDSVVLISPYYFSHLAAIQIAGARAIVTGFDPLTFQPDIEEVLRHLRSEPKPKCVILTTPNNPSGVIIAESRMRALEDICRVEKVWLVVDEAYDCLTHDSSQHVAPISTAGVIRLFTMSKVFGMAGWRVGCMIFDPVLTPVLLKIQDAIPTHPAIASQLIALQAIQITSHGGACSGWIEENVYKLKKCRDVIFDAVEATGAIRSYGAIYYFVPLPVQWRNQTSEVEAMRILAEKFQVLLTPGRAFGAPGYFRVSYGSQPDDVCLEAAGRLKRGLSFLAEREPTVPATSKRSERSQE